MSENERELYPSNEQQGIKRYSYDCIYILEACCKNITSDNQRNFACYKQSKGPSTYCKLVRPIVQYILCKWYTCETS